MLAKDQVINTYRALNNWRSFRLKLFIEGIIIGILSGLIISFFRWSLHLVETNREHIYTFLKNTDWYWTAFWFIALAVIAFTLDRLTKYEPLAAGSRQAGTGTACKQVTFFEPGTFQQAAESLCRYGAELDRRTFPPQGKTGSDADDTCEQFDPEDSQPAHFNEA